MYIIGLIGVERVESDPSLSWVAGIVHRALREAGVPHESVQFEWADEGAVLTPRKGERLFPKN